MIAQPPPQLIAQGRAFPAAGMLTLVMLLSCGPARDGDGDAETTLDSSGPTEDAGLSDATSGPDAYVGDAPGEDAAVGPDSATDSSFPLPDECNGGSVTYTVGRDIYRTTFDAARTTENLSEALNALGPGEDNWMVFSPAGDAVVMVTERFGCEGWSCMVVLPGDLSSFEVVRVGGEVLHAERYSAIASGGDRLVYPDNIGGGIGLYAIDRVGGGWSPPRLLTGSSPHTYNIEPSISDDGSKVVFDCGEDVYSQAPTSICEVRTDGTGFRTVWTPAQGGVGAMGQDGVALHAPDYMPDGSIVFESSWSGEQIWRLVGNGPPVRVAGDYSNDNSPCALPNGCIVSLWLERPGSNGEHELKIMDPLGDNQEVLQLGVDVQDIGLSCAN